MCALMCSYILAIYVNKVNILQQIFNQPACPALPPTPGQPCDVAPAGPQDCHYAGDHCCCGRCFSSFVFSCVTDVETSYSTWQTTMCPSEGCSSSGEFEKRYFKMFLFSCPRSALYLCTYAHMVKMVIMVEIGIFNGEMVFNRVPGNGWLVLDDFLGRPHVISILMKC